MSQVCQNIRFIASAGTGKTHQVVSLYQALLLGRPYPPDDNALPGAAKGSVFDGNQRIPPDRILMLTFTRNAAAEMRSRVTEAIEKELATGNPDNEAFCWSLLRRLSGATISTIHAFAQQLLARHTLELGLSPTLTVLEEADAAILRNDAAQSALREALRNGCPAYIHDLETLCEGHGVEQIERAALQTITQCATWGIDLEQADPSLLVRQPAEPCLHDLQALSGPLQLKADAVTGNTIKAMASELRVTLRLLGTAPTPDAVAQAAGKLIPLTQKAWGKTEDVKALRVSVQATLIHLATYTERKEAARLLISFVTLAQDCALGIRARKNAQGVLDFDDLLFRARELIQRNPDAVPATDVIIVDEAQDNSRLQNELIRLVQKASQAAVAACGDTKQTIYSWRGADPDGLDRLGKDLHLNPIPLRTSYRSQMGILNWVNDIFAGVVMGTELYGETEELLPCPAAKASEGPAVECLLPDWELLPSPKDQITIPGKKSKTGSETSDACARITIKKSDISKLAAEGSTLAATDWEQMAKLAEQALALEARAVARRIRLLTTPTRGGHWHPPRVWDSTKQEWGTPSGQPYRFRDILILLRATQRQDLYEQALQEEQIPFTTDGAGRGFFLRQEVQDISNLLSWLAFPLDRQTLLAVLRSPFCALSDNAVAILSANVADPSLRSIVTADGEVAQSISKDLTTRSSTHDASSFLRTANLLRRLCELAGRVSAVELVREAVRLTGYDAILTGTFHGVQRLANLQKLLSWIQELERSENLDFQSVAIRLSGEILDGREAPDAAVLDPDDDSVRINTVHAAKGLSSPVVIVPDLRRTPRNDSRWIQVLRSENDQGSTIAARLKFYNEDDTLQEKVDSEGYAEEVEQNKIARDQESRRLFYVAATRARDLLIFSGENPNAGSGGSWRSWLNQHLFACDFKPELVRLRPYSEVETAWRGLGAMPSDKAPVSPLQLTQCLNQAETLSAKEQYRYPVTLLVRPTPQIRLASVSVTTKTADNHESAAEPEFIAEEDDEPTFSKSQLGTVAHRILETLDYHSGPTLEGQISQALEFEALAPAERSTLISGVTAAASRIAILLEGVPAKNLIRELPFAARFRHDGAEVIVDGKVDLLYFKNEAWHILDYKFSSHTSEELTERYALQLATYRESLFTPDADGSHYSPRFETNIKTPATFTLTLLGITSTGDCTVVDVTAQAPGNIAAHLINAARFLSRAMPTICRGEATPALP
ncbi:MAG: UvrD-helicase domain-containing protein [bacterium]